MTPPATTECATSSRVRDRGSGSRLPQEARDGLMRAWLAVLSQRHPHVGWIPVFDNETNERSERDRTPPDTSPTTTSAELPSR